jgi:transcriptional regulator with XRE-family HTH domain
MSQEALAYEANIDRTYVSQLERALVNPLLAVIVRLVCWVDISIAPPLTEADLSQGLSRLHDFPNIGKS